MAAVAAPQPTAARREDDRARAPPESSRQAATISRKALSEPGRSSLLAGALQRQGFVSSPDDAAEVEADRIAAQVVAMPEPAPRSRATAAAPVQRAAARVPRPSVTIAPPAPSAAPRAASGESPSDAALLPAVRAAASGGAPLSRKTRALLEPRFGADFSGVRIHTGPQASHLARQLAARAFAYGRHIFFNDGEYQPDTPAGQKLLAHELTHTIQQREVIQRKATVQVRTGPHVQRGVLSAIGGAARAVGGAISDAAGAVVEFVGDVVQVVKDFIADKATIIPGFRLLCLILGRNPINDAATPGGGRAILQELAGFMPFGDKVLEALTAHGIIDKGGAFIDEQLAAFKRLVSSVTGALGTFFSSLGPRDALNPGGAWDRAKSIFTAPLNELKSFAGGLVSGFVTLVREVILKPLGRWAAANVPKWDLLMAVLGKNPVSDEGESPASAVIGAFMNLIGQGEIWENIQKAKAIPRAWQWFQNALKGAKALVSQIPGLVVSTIKSLTIVDVITIVGAFRKIVGAFGSFVGSLFSWAGGTVLSLLEIILEVVAPAAVPYLKKAGGAFKTIIANPIGFVRTLVAAGKAGFQNFAGNFLTHLKAALIGWLTGSLAGAGVYIPKGFTVLELLKFVLSVLGLTWANLRGKLVKATNETTVKALETGFQIVKTLVTEGPAAAWQEIVKTLTNLKQMAIDAVMDFVKSKIVEIAVTKLLSMLSPAGAFIQALIAIYNTIMFFVERIRQIAQVAASFIDSIAAIASGNIGPAAARVEKTLAGLLVLVISFLARLAGLGKVSDAVLGLVKKIRAPIDKALDSVVAWIVAQARKLGKFVAQAGVPQDPAARLKLASAAAIGAAKVFRGKATAPLLTGAFGFIKTRYALTSIEAFDKGGQWFARIRINPDVVTPLEVPGESTSDDPAAAAVLALVGTKIVAVAAKGPGKLVYTKPIEGYAVSVGTETDNPSIKRTSRPKGKPQLPAVHLDDNGVLAAGEKVHQKRSSEADKLKMYRALEVTLGLGVNAPEVTEANVNAASASKVRNAIRTAILDSPKYQSLSDFNKMISSGALTGPGMQGELFEAWVVKHFGSSQGISDSKIKYKSTSGVGLMDRSAGSNIVEIKSRVRPDVDKKYTDDDIPSTKFSIGATDTEQFTRYAEILAGKAEMITKSSGSFTVPSAFTGARYYFNFRGVATLFKSRMPAALSSKTVFYLGGTVITP